MFAFYGCDKMPTLRLQSLVDQLCSQVEDQTSQNSYAAQIGLDEEKGKGNTKLDREEGRSGNSWGGPWL